MSNERPSFLLIFLAVLKCTSYLWVSDFIDNNELVIKLWSPTHLREELKKYYWKADKSAVSGMLFWEDTLRYLYLPRLKNRAVLEKTIAGGADSRDFFGIAYGQFQDRFDDFKFGAASVTFDDTLLLIEPAAATAYQAELLRRTQPSTGQPEVVAQPAVSWPTQTGIPPLASTAQTPTTSGPYPAETPRRFHGNIEIPAATARMRLFEVWEEIITVLIKDPNAEIKLTLEMEVEFPDGASDLIKRAVTENAKTLGFKNAEWE